MTNVKIEANGSVRFSGDLDDVICTAKVNGIIGTRVTMSDGSIVHFRLLHVRWQARLLRKGDLITMISVAEHGSDVVSFSNGIKWAFVSRNFTDVCLETFAKDVRKNAEVGNA